MKTYKGRVHFSDTEVSGLNLTLQALHRLTPREQYDRAYRMKRASHASVLHNVLPKEEWTKPQEVSPLSLT